jgi:hypothetical protein
LDNLYHQAYWGIAYLERYTNTEGQPAYFILATKFPSIFGRIDHSSGYAIAIKLTTNAQRIEVIIRSTAVRQNFPAFTSTPTYGEINSLTQAFHEILAKTIIEFCQSPYQERESAVYEFFSKIVAKVNSR